MQRNTFHLHIIHHHSARRPSLPACALASSGVGIGRDPSCYSEKWFAHLHYRAALRARQSGYDQFVYPSPRRAHLLCRVTDTVLPAAGHSPKVRVQKRTSRQGYHLAPARLGAIGSIREAARAALCASSMPPTNERLCRKGIWKARAVRTLKRCSLDTCTETAPLKPI
jgi:hypothetical protein